MNKPLQVVCAVIVNANHYTLACQRNSQSTLAGKWEFPGGKIEAGENAEQALKREIREELDITISILQRLTSVTHHYPTLTIELHPFLCCIDNNEEPKALEHENLLWVSNKNALELDWAEADIPVLNELIKRSIR